MPDRRNEWDRELDASTAAPEAASAEPGRVEVLVPALTIVAHPDPGRVGERVLLPALGSGRPVALSRLAPSFGSASGGAPRPLGDPRISRTPIVLSPGEECRAVEISAAAGRELEVLGAGDPAGPTASELERGVVLLLAERVALLLHLCPSPAPEESERFGLLGGSAPLLALCLEIQRLAEVPAPILLLGETGSGKELVARALHAAGSRRMRPFVAVNMAAVPPSLAAAELFGAARGAFTGADRPREGYFQQAHGGTLLLDEIGETPAEIQALLLRALESGEIQPVGAEKPQATDIRVIAATDADLEAAVAQGRFRAPLLHRLRGCEIRLPPLRERRDDIGRLLLNFLSLELGAFGLARLLDDPGPRGEAWLPARLVARLVDHDWPGNVRELRNAARQIAAAGRFSARACLPAALERELAGPPAASGDLPRPARQRSPRRSYRPAGELGENELLAALEAGRFNLAAAAGRLGISRASLYVLLGKVPGFRQASELDPKEIAVAVARAGGDLETAAAELKVSLHGLKIRRTELGIS
jgi:two-component system nitrogen regulation response regulator GlnG